MLGFLKAKGISIKSSLGLAEQLSPARLKELVVKIRNRSATEAEKEEVIRGHLGLALFIASRFAAASPIKDAELFTAEALFGLVKAVDDASTALVDDNITPYVSTKIKGVVYRAFQKRYPRRQGPIAEAGASASTSLRDLHDMIDSCIKFGVERQIIELRKQGFKDNEIAEKLQCSASWVRKNRDAVRQRFESLEEQLR